MKMDTLDHPFVHSLYRYPIKGFNGQSMNEVQMIPGKGFPFDRFLGITNGEERIDESNWSPCSGFVRMTRNENLPLFDLTFDENSAVVNLYNPIGEKVCINLNNPLSLELANSKIEGWFSGGHQASPTLARRNHGQGWWDFEDAHISIINLATIREIGNKADIYLDPLRFRGNIYIDGLEPWCEFKMIGRRIRIGKAELEIIRPIERCKATSIDPTSADNSINVPALLAAREGHLFCGMYAKVVKEGMVKPGDTVQVVEHIKETAISEHSSVPPIESWPRYARVIRREKESNNVDSFWIHDPLAQLRVKPLPGQHLRVHLSARGTSPQWRSYTISGVDGDYLRLSIKKEDAEGAVSQRMHDEMVFIEEPGHEKPFLLITGPFGYFHLEGLEKKSPLVFVSAGIGITPTVAMLRALVEKNCTSRPIFIFHGARNVDSLALWNEVYQLTQKFSNANINLFLSEFDGTIDAINYTTGRITASAFKNLPLATADVYICGPGGFASDIRQWLIESGANPETIHHEAFASPSSSTVKQKQIPVQGPFFVNFNESEVEAIWNKDHGTVLDLADTVGLNLPANCRSGVCGACKQKLSHGEVLHLIMPPFPLNDDEVLTCCAVPLSDITLSS